MARRLFVAIDLPAVCRETLVRLNPKLPGVPWQKPEQLHLTLSFLGRVEPDVEERLKQLLPQVMARTFELEIRSLGTFGERHPKVLWTGVGEGRAELEALQAKVRRAIAVVGLPQDQRPFHPHVTLSRLRTAGPSLLRTFLGQHEGKSFGKFTVNAFVLYSSEPGVDGSVYHEMMRMPLEV